MFIVHSREDLLVPPGEIANLIAKHLAEADSDEATDILVPELVNKLAAAGALPEISIGTLAHLFFRLGRIYEALSRRDNIEVYDVDTDSESDDAPNVPGGT